ncbi:hypothetical protein [Acaryochloris marina]|uniref:hypothetical protein n=1 Tax=Acaryochloris marina TaxID=155978 RepID=UPI0021C31C79|nr:hypothetical protein [Acaryochloris marina]BDM83869.1 hypothetical protein AM10699_67300 [Acaryochloris marina MBIC10699]
MTNSSAYPSDASNFQSWVERTIAGMLSVQKEIQESQLKIQESQLQNSQDIAELRKITSDLVGYSINQESDIQTVREDLQTLKRRVDALDGGNNT